MPLPASTSLLITGPAASGKSKVALERFRSVPRSLLVVSSATMAEHLRHQMTREGFPIRPSQVQTLAQFLEERSPLAAPPAHLVHLLIQQALEQQRPPRFQAVSEFEGLHAQLADLFEEAPPWVLPDDLAQLLEQVERDLLSRGMALRRTRLSEVVRKVRDEAPQPLVVFDGFFTFSQNETQLLAALSLRTQIILTLPDWPATDRVRQDLTQAGFAEQRHKETFRIPRQEVYSAATAEREVEEIARRILEVRSAGRAFRDIGIVLRSRDPYAPLLLTTLARFAIPARGYFSDALDRHPAIQFFLGILGSILGGWDHAVLLAALRNPVSGVGATAAGDKLDFEWRKEIPGRGLPLPGGWEPLSDGRGSLTILDSWRYERLGAKDWAARVKSLRRLVPIPQIQDRASRLQADAWRSTAAALDAFEAAMDETADALGPGPMPLGSFGNLARRALALKILRVPDRRRDVVHIMDVFEARQWELPVVFVCGLTERHFPQYHREDPLLGDSARRKAGLETAASRQALERSLFDFAVSRATQEAILSYPRFDDKGEETLRSFFLDRKGDPVAGSVRSRRQPPEKPAEARSTLQGQELGQALAERHKKLSPSSIETFAQCAFKFFAGKTLRLHERPPAPRNRLDIRAQGNIIHRALAEWVQSPLLGAAIFDRVFEEECSNLRIPMDYRTEAVRLAMLRNFTAFIADPEARLAGWETRPEQDFEFALYPGLSIRGRIDRLEVNARGEALVIDYKYSAPDKLRERVKQSEAGRAVQAGLYLLAAERQFKLKPVGMQFCGLRKGVSWVGWRAPEVSGEALRDVINAAERTAVEAHEGILSGRIVAAPADPDQCQWCDFRDACRVETIAAARGAGS